MSTAAVIHRRLGFLLQFQRLASGIAFREGKSSNLQAVHENIRNFLPVTTNKAQIQG